MAIEKSKTNYFKHSFNLSDGQIKSIKEAVKNKEPIILKLSKKTFNDGNTELPLTKTDTDHIINNKGFNYSLNKSKMKLIKIDKTSGGFLPIPLILAAIAAAGSVAGGTAGIAKTILDNKKNNEMLEEQKRHNTIIENKIKENGDGLFLSPWKGNGINNIVKDFASSTKLDDVGQKVLRSFLKNLNDKIKIEKHGNGIYLSNY